MTDGRPDDLDSTATPLGPVVDALADLGAAIDATPLRLGVGGLDDARVVATELSDQITDYLLPALSRLDAPLLAVLGGSTGSGKSTITNSLARANVSPAGVLRPTTRAPVLICHPDDVAWFTTTDLLGDLPRVSGEGNAIGQVLAIRPTDTVGPGVALIDAPDIDSVELANRDLAAQLLAAADLWLFVTTAVRYADAVPWQFLERAQQRGMELAIVINRVPHGAAEEISNHLAQMLDDGGLHDVSLFPIVEGSLIDGRLPEVDVAELRAVITNLTEDAEQRAAVVRSTLDGALRSVGPRADTILAAARSQDAIGAELRSAADRAYRLAGERIVADLSNGTMLRGEVLERWQELIGTGELMRAVQSRISLLRDRIAAAIRGRAAATGEVQGEITSTLERLVLDHADAAALDAVTAWRQLPGGPQVLAGDPTLDHRSAEFERALAPEVRAWQDDVLELVRATGAGKRNTARVLAAGVNGIGVALMIVLFAQTGGITGGEVAVASGTAGISQALLNALFGEQAVRDLANQARSLLADRLGALLETDANRFRRALWATIPPPEASAALAEAIEEFRIALDHGDQR
ncbi:MAG: dynamin family protein [Acidimicrobiales bacterium]